MVGKGLFLFPPFPQALDGKILSGPARLALTRRDKMSVRRRADYGLDIPGWVYAEDLDEYFITFRTTQEYQPEVLAMTNDPSLVVSLPVTCEVACQTLDDGAHSWAAQEREERAAKRAAGQDAALVPGTTRPNCDLNPSRLILPNLDPL